LSRIAPALTVIGVALTASTSSAVDRPLDPSVTLATST
jgi:hypothetical protein